MQWARQTSLRPSSSSRRRLHFEIPHGGSVFVGGQRKPSLLLEAEGEVRKRESRLKISAAGRREYSVNGTIKRRVADVTGALPCVVFSPDDLRMVKDAAERRRSAIDGVGDQLSPSLPCSARGVRKNREAEECGPQSDNSRRGRDTSTHRAPKGQRCTPSQVTGNACLGGFLRGSERSTPSSLRKNTSRQCMSRRGCEEGWKRRAQQPSKTPSAVAATRNALVGRR